MFIGHFAVGFAAKPAVPRASLAVLFAAAQLADLIWPVLVGLGVEQVRIAPGMTSVTPLDFISYPWSHSLVLLAVWGIAFAGVYVWATGDRRAFGVLVAVVVSHWVLDALSHRPDMPIYPGGPRAGAGLWNSMAGTVIVECALYAVGLWLYVRATRARDRIGRWAFGSLAVALVLIYFGNLAGPPPPSVMAIAVIGLVGGALILVWAWWADRHREVVLR